MAINLSTAENRNRELRNVSLLITKKRLREALSELEFLINSTPTGERRNALTEVNIHCLAASDVVEKLSAENG